ncbi:hypothetical protein ONS95_001012 [Cadophora gregata]|uniref:uncharacterized protein n=1 Tax=Cadophora gregata TaxID=51156 RepID=UPI0026DD9178|nr:uncharacterized protein ONS95_001012 [Cadophora gregata]KAK0102192.1 hypothetical protein ONS96_006154 [Cadophora gregata f. sp. sojae]KAK0129071.1 hypothetical protein ONS95_001012 [Cadophora gregata]
MKRIPLGERQKRTGLESQQRVLDAADSDKSPSHIGEKTCLESNFSSLRITNSLYSPILQSGTVVHTPSQGVGGHQLLSSPLEALGCSDTLQTHITRAQLPPLTSWKHALLPVPLSVEQFGPPLTTMILHGKEQLAFQITRSSSVVEAEAYNPFSVGSSMMHRTSTKSPTLSLQSPESSTANSNHPLFNSSSRKILPGTLSNDHQGSWRHSTSHEASKSSLKPSPHSKPRSTATLLNSKSRMSWRRSAIMDDLNQFVSTPKPNARPARLSHTIQQHADITSARFLSPEFRTVRGNIKSKFKSATMEPLPEELNCAIFITNIPLEVTPSEIFDYIHCGAVQTLNVYQAHRSQQQAAKLVFAKAESAARLIDQAKGPFHVYMGRVRLHVAYNRDGALDHVGPETRVLIIEGPADVMTYEYWKKSFNCTCFHVLDRWNYRPCALAGRMNIEFRFLSAGMAKSCLEKIKLDHQKVGKDGVSVTFGRDICDANYLVPWSAPK